MAALASRAARADALTNSPDTAAFIDVSGDELILGGRPLSWWIETFGLPFHVSYAPDIKANLLAYKDVFERLYPRGEDRYAGKAWTHPAVFRLAAEAGVGIDVASPYETRCARGRRSAGKTRRKRQLQGRRSHQPRDQQEHADHCRQHCRARTHRPARQEPSRGAALRVAGNRLSARQSHVSFDFHRGRVEQVRHFHFRHSAALVSPRWNAGEVAWLPHPYRQPNHRSCCLSARAWQAHRARHCTPNGGTEIRGG